MALKALLFLFPLLIGHNAAAVIKLLQIGGGYSYGEGKFFNNSTSVTNTIYGGVAGTLCTDVDNISPCNNCADATGGSACNTRRIYDDLIFTVTISSSSVGRILVKTNSTTGSQDNVPFTSSFSPNVDLPANTATTISIRWGDICNAGWGVDGGCDDTELDYGTKQIRIGVDGGSSTGTGTGIGTGTGTGSPPNNLLEAGEYLEGLQFNISSLESTNVTLCKEGAAPANNGVCNFIAFPGDAKVYIESARANCSFPSVGPGATAAGIRVFYEVYPEEPSIASATFADLNIVEGATASCTTGTKGVALAKNEVGGLSNGTTYAFAIGVVDKARNVGLVTFIPPNGAEEDNTECYNTEEYPRNCHIAQPSEVIGLIEEDLDCFISTAAYGTPLNDKVKTLRVFRNQFFKTNILGRAFIKTYYKLSPPAAQWISQHPTARAVVRVLLWPVWAFAYLSLNWPWLLLLALIVPVGFYGQRYVRRVRS